MDAASDTEATGLPDDVTDEDCRLEYIEIVPLARNTDGPCTTDCDSGDCSAHVQENSPAVKQEPDDVCFTRFYSFSSSLVSFMVQNKTILIRNCRIFQSLRLSFHPLPFHPFSSSCSLPFPHPSVRSKGKGTIFMIEHRGPELIPDSIGLSLIHI